MTFDEFQDSRRNMSVAEYLSKFTEQAALVDNDEIDHLRVYGDGLWIAVDKDGTMWTEITNQAYQTPRDPLFSMILALYEFAHPRN